MKTFARLFVVFSVMSMIACSKNKADATDEEVGGAEGLTSFVLTADKNSFFQDIVFQEENNVWIAEVDYDVDLSRVVPTFVYDGKITSDGKVIESDKTVLDLAHDFHLELDGQQVKFQVKRYYAIPTLYVDTKDQVAITSKENYLDCSINLNGKNIYNDYTSTVSSGDQIRGRGNSTWIYYDKKPYRIRLGKKHEVLGLGASRSWVLLANYRDPSYYMNAITFDIGRFMGLRFTNSNRFVELYLNGVYNGVYQLTEQVQQGEFRVDIDKSSGYLLSLDLDDGPDLSPGAGDNFHSKIYSLPVCIKHPEDLSSSQVTNIREDFASVEQYIKNKDYDGLASLMHIQSMIDFLIIQELTRNVELVAPRSMNIHKDADGKYYFGPIWDFDGGFAFNWSSMTVGHEYFVSQSWLLGSKNPALHPNDAYNYISGFFVDMFGNPTFLREYKARWAALNQGGGLVNTINTNLDNYKKRYAQGMLRNAVKWPIGKNYNQEIEKLRNWLLTRITNYNAIVNNY